MFGPTVWDCLGSGPTILGPCVWDDHAGMGVWELFGTQRLGPIGGLEPNYLGFWTVGVWDQLLVRGCLGPPMGVLDNQRLGVWCLRFGTMGVWDQLFGTTVWHHDVWDLGTTVWHHGVCRCLGPWVHVFGSMCVWDQHGCLRPQFVIVGVGTMGVWHHACSCWAGGFWGVLGGSGGFGGL